MCKPKVENGQRDLDAGIQRSRKRRLRTILGHGNVDMGGTQNYKQQFQKGYLS